METPAKKTLLLVEDELLLAMAEKMDLERYGYEVLSAGTGEKAIATVKAKSVDLILMDIDLGDGMDGTEAAEIILKHNDIPILFLSSHSERKIVEKTERITCFGYVVKSSGITVLDASIKMAFKLSSSLEQERLKEKALAASEARYRNIFMSTRDGVFLLDAETGKALEINPFASELLGLPEAGFLKKAIWEIEFLKEIVRSQEDFLALSKKAFTHLDELQLETAYVKVIEVEVICSVFSTENERLLQLNIRNRENRATASRKSDALLASKEVIVSDVHQRMTGSMEIINSLMELQAHSAGDSAAASALKDAGRRIGNMVLLYDKLSMSSSFMELSLSEYLTPLIEQSIENFPFRDSVRVESDIADSPFDVIQLQPLGIIVNELLTNIMKYAFVGREAGRIRLSATLDGELVRIVLEDDGVGLPESMDFDTTPGVGLSIMRVLIQQLGGSIAAERCEGTRIVLEFERKTERPFEGGPARFQDAEGDRRRVELMAANNVISLQNDERGKRAAELAIANKELLFQKEEKWKRSEELVLANKELLFQKEEKRKRAMEFVDASRHIEENALMLKEVHHRIKNNLNTLNSLLNLQAAALEDSAAIEALEDASSRVISMMVLYDKLYQSPDYQNLSSLEYFPSLVDKIIANFPNSGSVTVEKRIGDFVLDAKRLQPLGIILNELLTNIMKYAFIGRAHGLITVSAAASDGLVVVTVEDDGRGIPESVSFENSTGFGLMLVKNLTEQLKGTIGIERGKGTRITLEFER